MITAILPIVLIVAFNVIMLYRRFSLTPLKLLRKDLKQTKQKRSIRLPNISFMKRFNIRVILQNIGNYTILFFGLAFASLILLFGLSLKPILTNYASSMREAAVSEYQYLLKGHYQIDDNSVEGFSLKTLETYYSAMSRNLEVSFYGIPEDTKFWGVQTKGFKENEIVLSDSLSKKVGIKVGDVVSFVDSNTNEKYEFTVVGIKDYPVGFSAFMNRLQLNELMDYEPEYISGYVSNKLLDIPEEYLATVITSDDLTKLAEQTTESFSELINICVVASAIIYIVVIYILTKIVIDKNKQSISFLKVMGYKKKEIKKLYLNATTIAVGISLLLSLPLLNIGLIFTYTWALARINGYIGVFVSPHLFALAVVMGFISYLLVNVIHMKQVDNIDMTTSLKTQE